MGNTIETNFEEFEIEKILNKKVEVIKNQLNSFGFECLRHKISDKAEKVEQVNNLIKITKTKKQISIMTATGEEKDEIAEKAAVSVMDFGFDVFFIKKEYKEDNANGTYMYTYEFFINC